MQLSKMTNKLPVAFTSSIGTARIELQNAHQKKFGIRIVSLVSF